MWLMITLELYKNEINDGFKTWSDHFKGRKLVSCDQMLRIQNRVKNGQKAPR